MVWNLAIRNPVTRIKAQTGAILVKLALRKLERKHKIMMETSMLRALKSVRVFADSSFKKFNRNI